jgi:biopolymer transport protein ExbD
MEVLVGGRKTVAEVNVVPLIDILLVLLVIFMIIPHRQMGLDAVLPQQSLERSKPQPDVVVVVRADGSLSVNRLPVPPEKLRDQLEEIFQQRPYRVAFLQGDKALEFAAVARVIDVMKAARIDSVGLLTPELEKDR